MYKTIEMNTYRLPTTNEELNKQMSFTRANFENNVNTIPKKNENKVNGGRHRSTTRRRRRRSSKARNARKSRKSRKSHATRRR
jgi:hypothetical protein